MKPKATLMILAAGVAVCLGWPHDAAAGKQKPLKSFIGCKLIPTEWGDGDSFLVEFPEAVNGANRHVIRLYGADCMEAKAENKTDINRLHEQRRHFGLDNEQLGKVLECGKEGKAKVKALLAKPFSVHSAFAQAPGRAKLPRFYGFVETDQGKDLAKLLVQQGLARAHGVTRATPDGVHSDDYRAELDDLELQAAIGKQGLWKLTKPDDLPRERADQRAEERKLENEKEQLRKQKKIAPVNPNKANPGELQTLPGIGPALAFRIIGARPYKKPEDLLDVPGIGPATLEKIRPFLKFED